MGIFRTDCACQELIPSAALEHCNTSSKVLSSQTLMRILYTIDHRETKNSIKNIEVIPPSIKDIWERVFSKNAPITKWEKTRLIEFLQNPVHTEKAQAIFSTLKLSQSNENKAFIREYLEDDKSNYTIQNILTDVLHIITEYKYIIPIESPLLWQKNNNSTQYHTQWSFMLSGNIPGIGTYWKYRTQNGVSMAIIWEDGKFHLPFWEVPYESIYTFHNGHIFARESSVVSINTEVSHNPQGTIWQYNPKSQDFQKIYTREDLTFISNPDDYWFSITKSTSPLETGKQGGSRKLMAEWVIKFDTIDGISTIQELSIPPNVLIGRYTRGSWSRKETFSKEWFVHLTRVTSWDYMDDDFMEWYIGVGMYDPSAPGNFRVLVTPDKNVDGEYAFYGRTLIRAVTLPTQNKQSRWVHIPNNTYYYYKISNDGIESIFPKWLKEPLNKGENIMYDDNGGTSIICLSRGEWSIYPLTGTFLTPEWWETMERHSHYDGRLSKFSIQQWATAWTSTTSAYYVIQDGKYYYIGFPEKNGKYLDGYEGSGGWAWYNWNPEKILMDIANNELQAESLPLDVEKRLAPQRTISEKTEA